MYNHSTKKQVQYSLEQLAHGLFYHLCSKKLEDITVTEICKTAEITRRTFYRNCDSKADLILYSIDRLVNELLERTDMHQNDSHSMYLNFFSFWDAHHEFLRLLYERNLFDIFLSEFIEVCNDRMRYPLQEESLKHADNRENMRVYSNSFTVGGLGQMLKQWTADGFAVLVEDLTESIIYLTPNI